MSYAIWLTSPQNEPIIPGNKALLACEFKNEAGTSGEEPSKVELRLRAPWHTEDEYEVVTATRLEAYLWGYEFLATDAMKGRWYFWFYGEGVAADKGSYVIGEDLGPD